MAQSWLTATCLLGSSDFPASISQVAGTTGRHHYTQLSFYFFVAVRSHYAAQAGLELLGAVAGLGL